MLLQIRRIQRPKYDLFTISFFSIVRALKKSLSLKFNWEDHSFPIE